MKKVMKALLAVLVLAAVIGAGIGGYFIWRNSQYIGKDRALNIALADMGLERSKVYDMDVELDHDYGSARYEVEFEARSANNGHMEVKYYIDAVTGEIVYTNADRPSGKTVVPDRG